MSTNTESTERLSYLLLGVSFSSVWVLSTYEYLSPVLSGAIFMGGVSLVVFWLVVRPWLFG